jgi:Uma2 family endonuclease
MMLALDVPGLGPDLSQKANHSYYVWQQGKPPAVAIEVVSNREGGEDDEKMRMYAAAGVSYSLAIFDPWRQLSQRVLRVHQLVGRIYVEQVGAMLEDVGLGLILWQGDYEGENAL